MYILLVASYVPSALKVLIIHCKFKDVSAALGENNLAGLRTCLDSKCISCVIEYLHAKWVSSSAVRLKARWQLFVLHGHSFTIHHVSKRYMLHLCDPSERY